MRHKTAPCTLPCSVDRFCSFLGPLSIISQTQAELRPRTSQPFSTMDATLPAPSRTASELCLPLFWQCVMRILTTRGQKRIIFRGRITSDPESLGIACFWVRCHRDFFPADASSQQDPALHFGESFQLVGNSPCFRACQLPLRAGALGK